MKETYNDTLNRIPKTDEEAIENLRFGKEMIGESMASIFECERALGFSLMEAYEDALLAGVGRPARYYKPPATNTAE